MKEFSKIKNNLVPMREVLIEQYSSQTGLPKENITKLYESFDNKISLENVGIELDQKIVKINESFSDFINNLSGIKPFDYENFEKEIITIAEAIIDPTLTEEAQQQLLNEFNLIVEKYCNQTTDIISLFEIVCFVLILKNKEKFEPIAKQLQFGQITSELFESQNPVVNSNLQKLNVSAINTSATNSINSTNDIKLYGTLRDVLSKNNKRWGHNYHLDNVYQTIVSYIDSEIKKITNDNNIYTLGDNFHSELFQQLIKAKQINQEYRYVDYLRTVIPDIQTLVFDCVVMIHNYVNNYAYSISFLNRNTYVDYLEATNLFYSLISNSLAASKVIDHKLLSNIDVKENEQKFEPQNNLDLLKINYEKFDLIRYPLQLRAVVDMLHIVKSCESEFNLKIRKILNLYFTKAMNLVAASEKVLLEQRKTNKFKQGF